MTNNNGQPEASVETTSVFRADLLKEMESSAGQDSAVSGVEGLRPAPLCWLSSVARMPVPVSCWTRP